MFQFQCSQRKLKMSDLYNFRYGKPDAKSLILMIQNHGENLIGAEIGVLRAESLCTILQTCENVKLMYGVDSWQPYSDYLKFPYDGTPAYTVSEREIETVRFEAYHNIKWSGEQNRVKILEMDSSLAVNHIQDEELDFIFIDTYLTKEQASKDLEDWYPKVKSGGLFAGHDWDCPEIQTEVRKFRKDNNIQNRLCTPD